MRGKDFLIGWLSASAFFMLIDVLFGWSPIRDLGVVPGSMFAVGCGMAYGVWRDLYRGWVGE